MKEGFDHVKDGNAQIHKELKEIATILQDVRRDTAVNAARIEDTKG
ncbi:hypothetical protein [Vibrio phage RYC]|nr:hypothetical protein [Vibrio phage RYC]